MKGISRFLSISLLKTFLLTIILTIVSILILYNPKYRTFEQKQGDAIEYAACIMWIFFLVICALTVYFNNIRIVRENIFLRLNSFFLLPIAFALSVRFSGNKDAQWDSFFISTVIFILIHLFFYYRFTNKYVKKND